MDPAASSWFLLVTAVGPDCRPSDCRPMGGRPPDIELRAGTGLITAVPKSPATATIADESGKQVASASWTRDSDDVFTVELDITDPDLRTWSVRITNNDPEEVGFVWTSAGSVADGRQPRLVPAANAPIRTNVEIGLAQADIPIPIANIGTGPLRFKGPVGTDLGAGYSLKSFPTSLAPNASDKLTLGVSSAKAAQMTATCVLECNDPLDADKTLRLSRTEVVPKGTERKNENKDSKDDKDAVKESLKEGGNPEVLLDAAAAGEPSAHFIRPELRPDLSDSALHHENPDERPGDGQTP
ncbi:hypothetical protein ACIRRH_30785 [Kitasatospora sp. NPDC101235]|uniref:hypothetical protein n=1 Tax=Kitasatospora sp. NPDC101235 TaxID=3364101 RepID=UPI00382E9AA2